MVPLLERIDELKIVLCRRPEHHLANRRVQNNCLEFIQRTRLEFTKMLSELESYALGVLLENNFNDMVASTTRGNQSQGGWGRRRSRGRRRDV
jgi:hypothetical protein